MPKFTVILTRDVTESCAVEVEAHSADAAAEEAHALYRAGQITHDRWSLDDNYPGPVYTTNVEEA